MNSTYLDPTTDPRWQNLVETHNSSIFHSPGWIRVLKDTYDLDTRAYVILNDDGIPIAGIPFCHIDDIMDPRTVALPFSDYCDPLVDNQQQWTAWADAMIVQGTPVVIRPLHNDLALNDKRFSLYNRAKWHGMDLQPDNDALWSAIESSSRRAIKKARNNGVTIHRAQSVEDVRTFFTMHLNVRKYKYRLLAQPYRFFENIWHYCVEGQGGFILFASYQDDIIGGIFFLGWKNTLYYKFNASSSENLSVRPNDLMIWEGIQHARAGGYTYLDFGLSDWDQEGLIRYKRKFATDEKTISFLRYTPPEGPSNQTARIKKLLPQLTDLFTDETVPDQITEHAGDVLYRFFT